MRRKSLKGAISIQNVDPKPVKQVSLLWKIYRLNFDQMIGTISLAAIITYVITYGVLRLHGFIIDNFNVGYVVIIIPIMVVDGLRGVFDIALSRAYKHADEDLSKVTVVIACKDGEDVIGHTLRDLLKKFSPDKIIVSSNGSTDRTCEIARDYKVTCLEIHEGIGKVRAINRALEHVMTPYVLLIDDDTLINGAHIPTALLEQGYGGVAFRLHIKVTNWISKLQAHEYRKGSDIGKRRHNEAATVQNISGAIGLFTLKELRRQTEYHTGEFSGEDLQRTLLLHMSDDIDHKGVVLADSVVLTEPPVTLRTLYKQRVYGWFPGQYANLNNYLKVMLSRHTSLGIREDAFYNVFLVMVLDIIRILALPIMIFYPWYFVVMYLTYALLEVVAYLKNGHREPFWVVLVYPFYGLFGLITRLGAFCVFLYRRIVVRLCRYVFLDDYRRAPKGIKFLSTILVTILLVILLGSNIEYNFSRLMTNIDYSRLFNL